MVELNDRMAEDRDRIIADKLTLDGQLVALQKALDDLTVKFNLVNS